jgi:carbon monoxide dehydrogenase subunit G
MMELEHSFTVPVPPERAWDVLLDVQRVAPCMPGATLDSVEGDDIKGRIKVKVGPISMTYAGTAHFGERDTDAGVIVLEASGKETRGAGTASAIVRSQLQGENGSTRVVVHTSLNVTGRPAQFGRGVMAEVGGKLIGIFADNLAAMLAADGGAGAEAGAAGAAGAPGTAGTAGTAGAASAPGSAAGTGAGSGSPAVPSAAVVPEEPTPAVSPGAGQPQDRVEAAAAESMDAAVTGTASDVLAVPVEDLNLAVRSYNSLRREGVHTLGDLAFRTEEQLLAMSNIGPASLDEIKVKLAHYQLSLAGSNIEGTPLAGGTDAPGAPPAPADAEAAGLVVPASPAAAPPASTPGPGSTVPAMPIPAGVNSAPPAPVAPPAPPAPRPAAPPAEADLNLLKVAGPAVLKRAAPVLAGLTAAAVVVMRLRRRRRRR